MNDFIVRVKLSGYQAILKPSKYGYSMRGVIDKDLVHSLKNQRKNLLEECSQHIKNKRQARLIPEPWEINDGQLFIKMTWKEEWKPRIVDSQLNEITDIELPLYQGSVVNAQIEQRSFRLCNDTVYGTALRVHGIQVIDLVPIDQFKPKIIEFQKCEGYQVSS